MSSDAEQHEARAQEGGAGEEEEEEDRGEWKDSAAKDYLYSLIVENKISPNLKPKQVYEQFCQNHPTFKNFQDYKNFASRLGRLREKHATRNDRAEVDDACLAHDRTIFPEPTIDTSGNAMWQKSTAQQLLRQDITDGKHKTMKPKELYETREEYYENYNLDFFRERIYQEQRRFKHQAYLKDKADAKAQKEVEKAEKNKQKKEEAKKKKKEKEEAKKKKEDEKKKKAEAKKKNK